MELEDKRKFIKQYCDSKGECKMCMFDTQASWCMNYTEYSVPEDILDREIYKIIYEERAKQKTIPDTVVRHFKGGDYVILHIGYTTTDSRCVVIYRALYPPYNVYVRDYKEFCDFVERDGEFVERFRVTHE